MLIANDRDSRSGRASPVSPNGTGSVCLSQMAAIVALGAVPPLINTTMAARRARKIGTIHRSKGLIRLYRI